MATTQKNMKKNIITIMVCIGFITIGQTKLFAQTKQEPRSVEVIQAEIKTQGKPATIRQSSEIESSVRKEMKQVDKRDAKNQKESLEGEKKRNADYNAKHPNQNTYEKNGPGKAMLAK